MSEKVGPLGNEIYVCSLLREMHFNVELALSCLRGPTTLASPRNMRLEQLLTSAESFITQAVRVHDGESLASEFWKPAIPYEEEE